MDWTNDIGMFMLLLIGIAGFWWHMSRSTDMLRSWASENRLTLVESERRYLGRGPYFWTTSKGQEVFYVTVEDEAGETRHAYVRCGGFWLGLLSGNVDVHWVD